MDSPALSIQPIPAQPISKRILDRQLWLAVALAALVLLPRAYLITHAQSEHADDEYHIARGLIYWADRKGLGGVRLNDPPLGEAIGVLPLWLANCWKAQWVGLRSFIWGQKYSADTILNVIGLWKSLLFLPVVGVAFTWMRGLYGRKSAWLAVGLLLVEPTFAAHTPLASIDVFGMEATVIASFLAWRYFQRPTWGRLIAADVATAAAILIKHTGIIMPIVGFAFALLWWVVLPWRQGQLRQNWKAQWKDRLLATVVGVFIVATSFWTLLKFDYSRPMLLPEGSVPFVKAHPVIGPILNHKLPGGIYIGSFIYALQHAQRGHDAYLLGQYSMTGWWYYFPVVSTYKVPIGIGIVLFIGLLSLAWVRPRWDEWGLFIPMLVLTGLMLTSHINIGWRHFLPAYAFLMLLAVRAVSEGFRGWTIAMWAAIGLAWVDTLRYHPNYISYITYPREKGWLAISDSNVDWGQGLKDIHKWMNQNRDKGPVFVRSYLWYPTTEYARRRLGRGVTILDRRPATLPTHGILIISPVSLVGDYEFRNEKFSDPYRELRKYNPLEVLGHSMMVYDLDKLNPDGRPIDWGPQPPPAPRPRRRRPPAVSQPTSLAMPPASGPAAPTTR